MSALIKKFETAQVVANNENLIDEILAEDLEEENKAKLQKETKDAFARLAEQDAMNKLDSKSLYLQWGDKTYKEADTKLLNLRSRLMEFIATVAFGSSDSLLMARWSWWTVRDINSSLPALKPKGRSNDTNRTMILATTQKHIELRNQFVNNFTALSLIAVGTLAFALYGIMWFIALSILGKATFILFVSSVVVTMLKGRLKEKLPSYGAVKKTLICSTVALMIGQYGYGVYLEQVKKAEALKVLEIDKHNMAVSNITAILSNLEENNTRLISSYDSNKNAVSSKLNVFLNTELEPLVKTLIENKKDLGEDYDSQVKKLVNVIAQDTPIVKKLVAEGIMQQSDAVAIQNKVNEQLGKL